MKKIFLLSMLSLLSIATFAQQMIKGSVSDKATGDKLPGVSVVVEGTLRGTSTDFDGNFEIQAENGEVLIFSFVGMKTRKVEVSGAFIELALESDARIMDEVVLIGYGVQKKSDVTGAIASVDTEALESQPVATAENLLQGRAAGVQVTSNSGAPGAGATVRIRGTGTVNNSSPIYVVDGIFLNDISQINPNDIESMEVLKDASSTAIYGSRGANGVILVKTKSGKPNSLRSNIEVSTGWQSAWKKPEMLNSEEWLDVVNISRTNGGLDPLELVYPSNDIRNTTNWFNEVTQVAPIQKIDASVEGGTDKNTYFIGIGYFDQQGIVKNSSYDRINLRINNTVNLSSKLTFASSINIANSNQEAIPADYYNGILNVAQKLDPITPVRSDENVDSELNPNGYVSSPYTDVINPVAYLNRKENSSNSWMTIFANAYLQYEPIKNLFVKSSVSLNVGRSKAGSFQPVYYMAPDERRDDNIVNKSQSFSNGLLNENTVSYSFNIDEKHKFSVLGGYTVETNYYEFLSASASGVPGNSEELQYINAATGEPQPAYNNASEDAMISYLARATYNYDDKYYLFATFRRDGSSLFGPESKWGNFPSFSAGWNLHKEDFLNLPEAVSNLKIRGGWGKVGNAKIDPYQYTSTVATNASWAYSYAYVLNDRVVPGAAPNRLANSSVGWETVQSTNIAFDLGLLNNKIQLTFDYFWKTTKDMLVSVPLPTYAGYLYSPDANVGDVANNGFELDIKYMDNIGSDFTYDVAFNISHIKNEVLSLGGGNPITGGGFRAFSTTRTEEGRSIAEFYGYVVEGVFQTDEEAADSHQPNAKAGDFIFKDVNEDGVLSSDDRTFIGSAMPDLFYGLNFSAQYKGFDFSMFWQGEYGKELFNAQKYYYTNPGFTTGKTKEILNYWYPGSGINDMFGLNASSTNNNMRESSFYIEDGSYLRLKNLQLGYTFKFSNIDWMNNLRVYFSGQNLLTFTKYSGLDPEIGGGTLSQGLDYGTYPQARVYSLGARLTF